MSARPKVKCAACGSLRTAKLFNAAGVQFKGSGFYVTDSRGKPGGTESGSGPKPDSKPAGKAESKPDTAADKPPAPAPAASS